ncbi:MULTISPECIES: hypothetical protein [Paenibacillus]|uniref:Phage protein n=1 Tax=Paenibacillus polymyxa TaxID=1406 RepID=A0ABX2ZA86_PAEPO|nr:hypothetical protein [Paenibacillus polymyxa]KAF6630616.1 hypothetical protein H6F38_14410 [Paenibacillus sp. EKM208P]ODA08235.1 hypothetical protein A7312_27910 [Paenibacillus polymyxa]
MSKKAMCINNNQATKSRKEFVQYLMSLDELKKSDGNHVYYLTHTYNNDPNRKLYFKAPYDLDTINAICAYIQFECSEIEMSYSMDESEVIEILEKFYSCSSTFSADKGDVKTAQKIDLYFNWETHCGSNVQTVSSLKRKGMDKYFKRYVDGF